MANSPAVQTANHRLLFAHMGAIGKLDQKVSGDIGQMREDLLGLANAFWSEWLKQKTPWRL